MAASNLCRENNAWVEKYDFDCRLVFGVILLVFTVLCFGYGKNYKLGVFPDEMAHISYVGNVVEQGFPDYAHGIISNGGAIHGGEKLNYLNHPFLYYFSTGVVAKLMGINSVYTKELRLVNYFFGVLILFCVYWGMKKINLSPIAMGIGMALLLCVPMLIVLCVSVNNDILSMLGVSAVFVGLLVSGDQRSCAISCRLILVGAVIAALSKATGALAVVCILGVFFLINRKYSLRLIGEFFASEWKFIAISVVVVGLYYAFVYVQYGGFFPRAGTGPESWWAHDNPDAIRWGLLEHLSRFYDSNLATLLKPYGHVAFKDISLRVYALKLAIVVLIFLVTCVIFHEIFKEGDRPKFGLVLVVSFFVFMACYFLAIRRLHLEFGYPGAMQARYFFGFLSPAIIVAAIGFNELKNRVIRFICVLAPIGALVLSVVPAYLQP